MTEVGAAVRNDKINANPTKNGRAERELKAPFEICICE